MRLNFGELFQKFSKDRSMNGFITVPDDHNLWPESWKKIEFKEYTQHKKITLPRPNIRIYLDEAVKNRMSHRAWSPLPITLQDLSHVLFYSCGTVSKSLNPNVSRRAQASAGKRYPLEVYIINFREGDLERNVYHYNPESHTLDELWKLSIFPDEILSNSFSMSWVKDAACAICITGIPQRSVTKYGERAYRYMYLEAGAITHMMHLIGNCDGLGSIQIGGTDDKNIETLLDIDGLYETYLTSVLLGKKTN